MRRPPTRPAADGGRSDVHLPWLREAGIVNVLLIGQVDDRPNALTFGRNPA